MEHDSIPFPSVHKHKAVLDDLDLMYPFCTQKVGGGEEIDTEAG